MTNIIKNICAANGKYSMIHIEVHTIYYNVLQSHFHIIFKNNNV